MDEAGASRVEQWTVGDSRCTVLIWSDEDWARLPPSERPRRAHYLGGLGWVVACEEGGPMDARRMLIVEDHDASRNVMRSIFSRRGWQVETAASLGEARAKLEPTPDCLVLDLMLPDGDGEDLLRSVRASGLPTRVVVTTATNDPARLGAATALGPDALLRKPIDYHDICRACGGPPSD
jgi:CheY-like chemotaxis protein